MKVIIIRKNGRLIPFGSWTAVFENFTAEDLGFDYRTASKKTLTEIKTDKAEAIVFYNIIKSKKRKAAGRENIKKRK